MASVRGFFQKIDLQKGVVKRGSGEASPGGVLLRHPRMKSGRNDPCGGANSDTHQNPYAGSLNHTRALRGPYAVYAGENHLYLLYSQEIVFQRSLRQHLGICFYPVSDGPAGQRMFSLELEVILTAS